MLREIVLYVSSSSALQQALSGWEPNFSFLIYLALMEIVILAKEKILVCLMPLCQSDMMCVIAQTWQILK